MRYAIANVFCRQLIAQPIFNFDFLARNRLQRMSDELTALPEGWEWTTVADVAEKVGSGSTPRGGAESYKLSGIPLIRSMNVHFDGLKLDGLAYLDDKQADELKNVEVKTSDVLLNITGASIGRVTQAPPEMDGARVNQHVCIIRPNPILDAAFLSKYLASPGVQKWIMAEEYGATRQALTKQMILNFDIPLPPLNEQRRIVAKIEELRDRHQAAKQALEAVPKLCDRFRQSVLAAAFRGDLTADWREQNPDVEPASVLEGEDKNDLPATWCLSSIGDVIESLKYGTSKKSDYEVEGVPVLRIPNIGDGYINHDDLKYAALSQKEVEELKLIPGDILLIRSNGSVSLVGKSAVIREPETGFVYAGYLIRLRPNPLLIDSEYLNLCLSGRDLRLQIEVPARSTSGVHNINSQEVKKLRIPLPPIKEQKEVIRNVNFLFEKINSLMRQYSGSAIQLDRLNQSILAKAFRGELVEQDPNDEPASVLLERIRAERQQAETEGKRARRGRKGKETGG
ncbi:MAG: restriction endonuclease subunit S [Cyanobacteriota bacterium]